MTNEHPLALSLLCTQLARQGCELTESGDVLSGGKLMARIDLNSVRVEVGWLHYNIAPIKPLEFIEIKINL